MNQSRQAAYQQRHREAGLCMNCPRKATVGVRCAKHAWHMRLYNRKRSQSKLPTDQTIPENLQRQKRYPLTS